MVCFLRFLENILHKDWIFAVVYLSDALKALLGLINFLCGYWKSFVGFLWCCLSVWNLQKEIIKVWILLPWPRVPSSLNTPWVNIILFCFEIAFVFNSDIFLSPINCLYLILVIVVCSILIIYIFFGAECGMSSWTWSKCFCGFLWSNGYLRLIDWLVDWGFRMIFWISG